MPTIKNNELNEAVAALSRAIETFECRAGALEQEVSRLRKKRIDYLAEKSESLLPAISSSVLNALQQSFPDFVTSTVQQIFAKHRKVLGIFAGKGYSQTLGVLRTEFARHLDIVKYGDLRDIDGEIIRLTSEHTQINVKSRETFELLQLMQQAAANNVPLPGEVEEQLSRISKVARSGRVPVYHQFTTSRTAARQSFTNSSGAPSNNDDFDLLFYLVTDIPTSMRTLLFSAVTDHQRHSTSENHGDFSGGGASGDFQPDSSHGNTYSFLNSPIASQSPDGIGGLVFNTGSDLTTDDSLGAYS